MTVIHRVRYVDSSRLRRVLLLSLTGLPVACGGGAPMEVEDGDPTPADPTVLIVDQGGENGAGARVAGYDPDLAQLVTVRSSSGQFVSDIALLPNDRLAVLRGLGVSGQRRIEVLSLPGGELLSTTLLSGLSGNIVPQQLALVPDGSVAFVTGLAGELVMADLEVGATTELEPAVLTGRRRWLVVADGLLLSVTYDLDDQGAPENRSVEVRDLDTGAVLVRQSISAGACDRPIAIFEAPVGRANLACSMPSGPLTAFYEVRPDGTLRQVGTVDSRLGGFIVPDLARGPQGRVMMATWTGDLLSWDPVSGAYGVIVVEGPDDVFTSGVGFDAASGLFYLGRKPSTSARDGWIGIHDQTGAEVGRIEGAAYYNPDRIIVRTP